MVIASYLGTDDTAINRSGRDTRQPVSANGGRPRVAALRAKGEPS
jgi:hypothetical protein